MRPSIPFAANADDRRAPLTFGQALWTFVCWTVAFASVLAVGAIIG